MNTRKWNFSAGPATLPLEILQKIQAELLNWQGLGVSVMEISHRSAAFTQLVQQMEQDVRDLLNIPAQYDILFMSCGANTQFAALPMNILSSHQTADYIDTGVWSRQAINEAKRYAKINVVASGKTCQYTDIPARNDWQLSPNASYFHYTANETIDGVMFMDLPQVKVPLVADMTSSLFAQPITDITRYGAIYASAQKHFGIAGLNLLIIRKDWLKQAQAATPTVLQYQIQAEYNSLYSTPAAFCWYVTALMLQWIKSQGGVNKLYTMHQQRSQRLYQFIDQSQGFYRNSVQPAARSLFNIPMRLATSELEQQFLAAAEVAGFTGLKGHRLQGGIRISMYNGLPTEATDELLNFMQDFQHKCQ
jgi:phosphoserine aminotransferase